MAAASRSAAALATVCGDMHAVAAQLQASLQRESNLLVVFDQQQQFARGRLDYRGRCGCLHEVIVFQTHGPAASSGGKSRAILLEAYSLNVAGRLAVRERLVKIALAPV
jgi:hypothetical protein